MEIKSNGQNNQRIEGRINRKSTPCRFRASICAAVSPALLSLMVPVSGLLAPAERRPEFAAAVPLRSPGANTSLLLAPRAWQVGGTSAAMQLGECYLKIINQLMVHL
jgi:hypothetical protein